MNLLDLILDVLGNFPDKSEQIEVSCSADLTVHAARDSATEMLVNILENAFAYGRPPITVTATEQATTIEVRVRDHGPGVPKEFVPQLFKPFTRAPGAEAHTEGSGLGLWIVTTLAKTNAGTAWYEAPPDGGACFCLALQKA